MLRHGRLRRARRPTAGAEAVRVHRAANVFASRKRFEIDGKELLRTLNEFEDEGWELGAIYHSHTHTAPYPSQTDINFAANWPGLEWVIVGLAGERAGGPLLPDRGRRGRGRSRSRCA